MKKGKWLLQYTSPSGNRVTISLEGKFDVEKIKQLAELIELMNMSDETDFKYDITSESKSRRTNLKESLVLLIEREFKNRWFSSKDVVEAYYKVYGERIPMSTVSSYLSRLLHAGVLSCKGPKSRRLYNISANVVDA
ncbi:MAG: hypothetical protein QW743_05990 [Candidatus Methanomethylicia archaeon]